LGGNWDLSLSLSEKYVGENLRDVIVAGRGRKGRGRHCCLRTSESVAGEVGVCAGNLGA